MNKTVGIILNNEKHNDKSEKWKNKGENADFFRKSFLLSIDGPCSNDEEGKNNHQSPHP
jgi:hypothetical protein